MNLTEKMAAKYIALSKKVKELEKEMAIIKPVLINAKIDYSNEEGRVMYVDSYDSYSINVERVYESIPRNDFLGMVSITASKWDAYVKANPEVNLTPKIKSGSVSATIKVIPK